MTDKEQPWLAADVIIESGDGVVLIKRGNDPYKDHWAIPGGFVNHGEKTEDAAVREAREETGLEIKLKRLVGVYSEPGRDPRGHVVSVCYLGMKVGGELRAASDAAEAEIFRAIPWDELAFDHAQILKEAGYR